MLYSLTYRIKKTKKHNTKLIVRDSCHEIDISLQTSDCYASLCCEDAIGPCPSLQDVL